MVARRSFRWPAAHDHCNRDTRVDQLQELLSRQPGEEIRPQLLEVVDQLFRRLDGDAAPSVHQVIPVTLVVRGSGEIRPRSSKTS